MNKIGVFGGTFNPVHKGHEITAVEFYDKFDLDKLIIIPANMPPHKIIDEKVSALQRFEMCELCFEKYRRENNYNYKIEVSDIEIKKDGVSYTYDTIKTLRKIYPDDIIYFLAGSDMFLYLENWYKYKKLLEMCVFVIAFRNNNDNDFEQKKVLTLQNNLINQGYKIELLKNSPFEISSTELREKIKNFGFDSPDLKKYISSEVLNYIKERKIYVLQ